MKRTKTILLVLVFALTFSAIPIGLVTFGVAEESTGLPEAYDIGPELRAMDIDPASVEISEIPTFSEIPMSSGMLRTSGVIGQTMYIYSQHFVTGDFFWEVYQCVYVSEDVEVWLSLTNLDWATGDPRQTTHPITHTAEMLEHLVNEF